MKFLEKLAADRVLETPELLDLIFRELSRSDNARNARVSKQWLNVALDSVWREVDDLLILFKVLVDIRLVDFLFQTYSFCRSPTPADWKRFSFIAKRVRGLNCTTTTKLDQEAWDMIARTRTTFNILPNLLRLTLAIDGHVTPGQKYLIFMHENIRRLCIQMCDTEGDPKCRSTIEDYMHQITARIPKLRSLDLQLCAPTDFYETQIINLIRELPELTEVQLPAFAVTSAVVTQLSELPSLKVLEYDMELKSGQESKKSILTFSPSLITGAFAALRDLSLSASLSDVSGFLSDPNAPTALTHLFVQCPNKFETEPSIKAFLGVVARTLTHLSQLFLELRDTDHTFPEDTTNAYIALDTLLTLHKIKSLRVLEIFHEFPLRLTDDELSTFAQGLPQGFLSLHLNPEPFYTDEPGPHLSLSAIDIFAKYCPELLELGLYMKMTKTSTATLPSGAPFSQLESLNLGMSYDEGVSDCELVEHCKWLSYLCPSTCALVAGLRWERKLPLGFSIYPETIDHINKMLNLLLLPLAQVRAEERAKRQALLREVEDLRILNEVLRDSAIMRISGMPI